MKMNDEAKNLARNLHLLMEYHKHTQQDLKERSGVSQKTISNMLNPGDSRSPVLENVASVARAYNLQTWHLLIPSPPIELLINSTIEKLVDNYAHIDKQSQETVLRVAENTARYQDSSRLKELDKPEQQRKIQR